jgi:hypothetical protein
MAYIEDQLVAVLDRLTRIEAKINRALGLALGDARRDNVMSKALDTLAKEVEEQGGAVDSAVTLISGLAEQIRAAGGDEAKLEKLADDLEKSQQKLAQAVAANSGGEPFEPSQQ